MSEPKRPLPHLHDPDTRPFWLATRDKVIKYQQCNACGTVVFYPRGHCTGCLDSQLSWKESAGIGTVYTYSVVRQSYHPFFRARAPYVVAWVDLDEGPRLLSNVVGVEVDAVTCGMSVEVEWEEHESCSIPLFRPAPA